MGASESKLVFKQGIFRLSEQNGIAADDPYWTGFWELPESADDVFSLFSPADIRRTRDTSLANLETLVLAVTSRLFVLRNHPSFPDPDLAPARDALNCIRILTRLLPFLYEADNIESWEESFFWTTRRKRSRKAQISGSDILFDGNDVDDKSNDNDIELEKVKPLAEELIDTLIDFLFFSDFTLPKSPAGKTKISYAIWQTGVGCNTPVNSSKEFENNRAEVLRLLLTLASKSMYMSPNVLPVKGVKAITYITTCSDKQVVLSVLCSLLNTTLKYNPTTWRVPYDHVVFKDSKQILVSYCLQLLLILIIYPVPEQDRGSPLKNNFRHFLGRLHRPQDFQFLVDGMARILNQPLQATASYLPGSHKPLPWAPELIMLFWEAFQWNKRFRSFIVDTDRAHDFIVLTIFYAMDQRHDPSRHGLVRMCIFVLQSLSTEPNFGRSLNKIFENHDSLPASIREPNFYGTYADYLIVSVHNLITAGKGKLETTYPALIAILNNIAAYVEGLSQASSVKLMQLFNIFSTPKNLFSDKSKHQLLHSLLEVFNAILEHQHDKNPNFVNAIFRSQKRFQTLRDMTLDSSQIDAYKLSGSVEKDKSLQVEESSSVTSSHPSSVANGSARVEHSFTIGDDEDEEDNVISEKDAQQSKSSASEQGISDDIKDCPSGSTSSSVDEAIPTQLRGMSEKARGKLPAGQRTFSRQKINLSQNNLKLASDGNCTATNKSIESWLAELPLSTILGVITQLNQNASAQRPSNLPTAVALTRRIDFNKIEQSPIRVHLFEWSSPALGWYESLLWGFVFTSEILVPRGTAGVWNGTHIRLFKVQETAIQTPSLTAPRGAVDAVGSNLVQRIGTINLRGTGAQADPRAPNGIGDRSMTVRDV